MRRAMALVLAASTLFLPSVQAAQPEDPSSPRCEMGSCNDPLFTVQYPHTHDHITGAGARIRLPVHVYDGTFVLMVGHGDHAWMASRTAGTGYRPIRTDDGAGIAVLIVAERTDTSMGPFDELAVAFPVSTDDVIVPDDAGGMLGAVIDPQHHLWLAGVATDSQVMADLGTEYLSTPAITGPVVTDITIDAPDRVRFDVWQLDGVSITHADLRFEPATPEDLATFAANEAIAPFALDAATRLGSWRIRLLSEPTDRPADPARATVIGRPDPSSIAVARCCAGTLTTDPTNLFGAALAGIGFEPVAAAAFDDYRFVFDRDLR